MITLYPKGTTKNTANNLGEGILIDAISCEITEEVNGKYELEMTYPISGSHYKDIEIDKYIKTKTNPYDNNEQLFRIYGISKPINGIVTINAQHISYDASYVIVHPDIQNGESEMQKISITDAVAAIEEREILLNESTELLYSIDCTSLADYDKTSNITFDKISSLRNILYNSILTPYEVEIEWNNTNAILYKQRGSDRGVVINYAKNVEELEEQRSREKYCDAIYPYYWKNTSETSSGVTYKYQDLYIDNSYSTYSYNWLYRQDSSSSPLGKIKSLITSTMKAYVFKVASDVEDVNYRNKLYLWNSYNYVEVTDIDNWELTSEGTNDSTDFLDDVLNKIPIVGFFKSFIPTKEKMKAIKSVFSLYYSLFSLDNSYIKKDTDTIITTGEHISDYRYIKHDTVNKKYIIYAAYKDEQEQYSLKDQNRTNIEIYYDETYGSINKGIGESVITFYKAVYIKINDQRMYCGFQKYSNVKNSNFLYLGPQEGVVYSLVDNTKTTDYIEFFNMSNDEWVLNDFTNNHYLVYIYTANDNTYANTLFIPRVADNIEEIIKADFDEKTPTSDEIWPKKIFKVLQAEGSSNYEYKAFKDADSKYNYKIEDKAIYSYNVWTKIATTKGLDPAYPSTAGEVSVKTEKALLSPLENVYYASNAYSDNAEIVSYNKSYWYYTNDKLIQKDIITLSENDNRIFIDSITLTSQTKYYTYRASIFTEFDTITEVEKLPDITEDILNKLFAKSTKSGVPDYYIIENSKWIKLTIWKLTEHQVYFNNVKYFDYNTTEITLISSVEELPTTFVNGTLYIVSNDEYTDSIFNGCIFLNKIDVDETKNYLVLPVDVTSIADEYDSALFGENDLTSTTNSNMVAIAKILLNFLREKYIKAPENDPNKITNETTISYMHIEHNSSMIDTINLNKILLGDTIHIRYADLGISSNLRVKSLTYDSISNKYTDIVLGEISETLASSVVTNNDGVSVLANDTGYTNNADVSKIIAKSIQAAYISTETFEATNATVENLIAQTVTTQQLTAIEAEITNIKTEPINGSITGPETAETEGEIVTKVDSVNLSNKDDGLHYEAGIHYHYDNETKVLTLTFIGYSNND